MERLGQKPEKLKLISYGGNGSGQSINIDIHYQRPLTKKSCMGVDVFVDYPNANLTDLGGILEKCNGEGLKLEIIFNSRHDCLAS